MNKFSPFVRRLALAAVIFLLTLALAVPALAIEEVDLEAIREDLYDMFHIDPEEESGVQYDGDLAVTEGLDPDWLNILLLGTDNRTLTRNGRTDSMIILSYNSKLQQVKMTSIMRDTWVKINGKGQNKINAANVFGGPELAMRTVNEQFGMNIEKYVLINMMGFAEIIDVLGGVEVDITEGEMKYVNIFLDGYREMLRGLSEEERERASRPFALKESGPAVQMNGAQAMTFARIRNLGDDYRRTERQREVLTAMARRVQADGASSLKPTLEAIIECVDTNFTIMEVVNLALDAIQIDLDVPDALTQYRIPVDGTFEDSVVDGRSAIRPNFEKNMNLLHAFIYGED